jgi:8-oxo-dGTP pyrophosphatase MutT (NUDIX family)
MFTLPIKQKCVMYITHGNRLLVFDHHDFPSIGTQVPAGTLRDGEAPDVAALREAQEETGILNLRVDSKLGERVIDLTMYGKSEIQRRFFYHLVAEDETVEEKWSHDELDPSEGGPGPIRFDLYWVVLSRETPPILSAEQDDLLGDLMTKLGL